MKKIIIKTITIIIAFLLGILSMSYLYNKGNLDMTAHMAEAALPVMYFGHEGSYVNPTYGYTSEVDAACLRSTIVPIDKERLIEIALEKVRSVLYRRDQDQGLIGGYRGIYFGISYRSGRAG